MMTMRKLAVSRVLALSVVAWLGVLAGMAGAMQPRARLRVVSAVAPELAPGQVRPIGILTAPGGAELGSSRATDGTLAAWGIDPADGAVSAYVWRRPAAGWSSAVVPAAFPTVSGDTGSLPAIGDGFVAVSQTVVSSGSTTDILRPRANGWSGELTPSATLDGEVLGAGGDLVATTVFNGADVNVDVTVEPADGWAGTVAAGARLLLPDDDPNPAAAAISGNTIAVFDLTTSDIDIFTEPAGGWSGLITPTVRIPLAVGREGLGAAMALSGNTIAAVGVSLSGAAYATGQRFPVYLIHRSGGIWHRSDATRPVAFVSASGYIPDAGIALHGSSVMISLSDAVSMADGIHVSCPCATRLYALNGVAGTTVPEPMTWPPAIADISTTDANVTSDGTVVTLDGLDGIGLYARTPTYVAHLAAANLINPSSVHPAMRLRLIAPNRSQPVTNLQITLPAGLRLNVRSANKQRAITAANTGRITVSSKRTMVTLRLQRPAADPTIIIGPAALSETVALHAGLQRLAIRGGHRRLTTQITARSGVGTSSQSRATFIISR